MDETRYILLPPGGPAGPFWGVILQNGRVLATQSVTREDANLLLVAYNALADDPDTLEKIRDQTKDVRDLLNDREGTSSDHFITRAIIKAIKEGYTMTFFDFVNKLTLRERLSHVAIVAFVIIVAMLLLLGSPDCPQGLAG